MSYRPRVFICLIIGGMSCHGIANAQKPATADDSSSSANGTESQDNVGSQSNPKESISDCLKKGLSGSECLTRLLFDQYQEILGQTRQDQDALRLAVRAIDLNLDTLEGTSGCRAPVQQTAVIATDRQSGREAPVKAKPTKKQLTQERDSMAPCVRFIGDITSINRQLLIDTYSDQVRQNANLSNQIATRLGQLVLDSNDLATPRKRERFQDEYTLLADRFLYSRKFRVGFGATYSYFPEISYAAIESVDLSRFLPVSSGGAFDFGFSHEFRDTSFLGPLISAKAPYFDIDFVYPSVHTTKTTTSPVLPTTGGASNSNPDALFQSTTTSTLSLEYEFALRVGIGKLIERQRIQRKSKESSKTDPPYYPRNRFDWGIGLGLSGYKIENATSTDVRLIANGVTTFKDLTSAGTVGSASETSFNNSYWVGYYTFRISDEFEIGIDFRRYRHDDHKQVAVRGQTLAITAAYYPTFRRKTPDEKANIAKAKSETAVAKAKTAEAEAAEVKATQDKKNAAINGGKPTP